MTIPKLPKKKYPDGKKVGRPKKRQTQIKEPVEVPEKGTVGKLGKAKPKAKKAKRIPAALSTLQF